MKYLLFLIISGILCCCKKVEGTEPPCPSSYFIKAFPKRSINLENVMGSSFYVKSGNDTISYSIDFDLKTRNTLVKENEDTIFLGRVSRYRGMFFLSERESDSVWLIHAIKVKKDLIYGLTSLRYRAQMCKLDELVGPDFAKIEGAVFPDIIIGNEYSYQLSPKKTSLKRIYSEFIDKSTPDTIIVPISKGGQKIIYDTKELILESDSAKNKLVFNVYPNPCQNRLVLETSGKLNSFKCEIIDFNGLVVSEWKLRGHKNEMDVSFLSSGVYIVRIIDEDLNSYLIKLIKE